MRPDWPAASAVYVMLQEETLTRLADLVVLFFGFRFPTLALTRHYETILLNNLLISGRKAPERRCSSRTFRYGYLVTT